jgi:hypothetical protein
MGHTAARCLSHLARGPGKRSERSAETSTPRRRQLASEDRVRPDADFARGTKRASAPMQCRARERVAARHPDRFPAIARRLRSANPALHDCSENARQKQRLSRRLVGQPPHCRAGRKKRLDLGIVSQLFHTCTPADSPPTA